MKESDSTFETFSFSGESFNCYGLEIVKEAILRKGFNVKEFSEVSENNIMLSLYWPEQIYDFIRWKYKNSSLCGRKIIVGGNYPTTSPQAVYNFVDAIYLGDGELWDGKLNGDFIAEKNNPKKRAISKYIEPINYEDIQNSRRSFVEISRGCKNKCLFCQYGWLKPYREADIEDIKNIVKRCKTKSIRAFAADRFQHSDYASIRNSLLSSGKNDTGSDVSIKFLLKNKDYLKFTNKIRVGIEGLSYRLRKMVGKRYTDEDIVNFCLLVAESGIKSLDWYMIYGLPSETKSDINEFYNLISILDREMPDKYTIAIHWNAFTPSAQTPLQWSAPAEAYNKELDYFFRNTPNNRIKIFHKPRLTGEWTIIKRMLAIRGDENCDKLIFNMSMKESELKRNSKFVLKKYKEFTGMDLMGEWPYSTDMPWDKYCEYKKDVMIRVSKYFYEQK